MLDKEENNNNTNNYLKLFQNFDYEKYYKNFILIACLEIKETKNKINNKNNCISVKAKLRKILENWAKSLAIKNQLEQYHIISSFKRKGENCSIEGYFIKKIFKEIF